MNTANTTLCETYVRAKRSQLVSHMVDVTKFQSCLSQNAHFANTSLRDVADDILSTSLFYTL